MIATHTIIVTPITIWFRVPTKWHESSNFKKRLRYFVIGSVYMAFTAIGYSGVNKILLGIPLDYQWIAALFLPLIREFHLWFTIKINTNCVDGDFDGMIIFRTQSVSTR